MTQKHIITGVAVVVALAVIALFFLVGNPLSLENMISGNSATLPSTPDGSTSAGGSETPITQLVVQDEVVGTGAEARVGDTLSVNYTGKLQDGTVFDTSVGKAPIQFTLGAGQVIPGWDQGLQGMKVGGKRLLLILAALGYGASGYGPIPPNAPLVFEVELVGVTPQGQ